jgi:hypothetical protein
MENSDSEGTYMTMEIMLITAVRTLRVMMKTLRMITRIPRMMMWTLRTSAIMALEQRTLATGNQKGYVWWQP